VVKHETARILLVEDERPLREVLAEALSAEGFTVEQAATGAAGLAAFRARTPDLVLLDLMLPEMSGIEVCRAIRTNSSVPIIMVTAKASETDRIAGLNLGADDYVTKPFSSRELSARIRAVLRRGGVTPAPSRERLVRIGEAEIDLEGQRILRGGVVVHVKPKAFQLLAFLIANPGRDAYRGRAHARSPPSCGGDAGPPGGLADGPQHRIRAPTQRLTSLLRREVGGAGRMT
jgi:two-component system response regulator RegX3